MYISSKEDKGFADTQVKQNISYQKKFPPTVIKVPAHLSTMRTTAGFCFIRFVETKGIAGGG